MKTIRQSLGILIVGTLLFFLLKPFVQTHTHLKDVAFQVQWRWLISSFCLILFYWSAYLHPFATLIGSITEKHVSFRTAYILFHLANITRYLPGRIWGVVRLLSLSHRFGLSKTATASSLTLHVGIETAHGGILALSLLLSKQMRDTVQIVLEKMSGHTMLFTLTVIGILTGILFCIPKVASQARQFLKTLVPLLKNERLWVNVIASHILLWMCQGLAFFLFVKSLADVPWTDAGILTTCLRLRLDCWLSKLPDTRRLRYPRRNTRAVINQLYAGTTSISCDTALSCLDTVCRNRFSRHCSSTSEKTPYLIG